MAKSNTYYWRRKAAKKLNSRTQHNNVEPYKDVEGQNPNYNAYAPGWQNVEYGTDTCPTTQKYPVVNFSEDSIQRQLCGMVPRQASWQTYVEPKYYYGHNCGYENRPAWSIYPHDYGTGYFGPSADFAPFNYTAKQCYRVSYFDPSAYFAPCPYDITIHPYSEDYSGYADEVEGYGNLQYVPAEFWNGLEDLREYELQRLGDDSFGLVSMDLMTSKDGGDVENFTEGDTQMELERKSYLIWRDEWNCDFCGPECFCWTVYCR